MSYPSPGPISLRPMRWWDIPAVADLEALLFASDRWSVPAFWSELAAVPDTRYYVLASDDAGIIWGYAGLFEARGEAAVQTIAVASQARGRGVGRMLLEDLLAMCVTRGAACVSLEVRADNSTAIALYQRHGFRADGRRRDYYGRGHDALLMSAATTARTQEEVPL